MTTTKTKAVVQAEWTVPVLDAATKARVRAKVIYYLSHDTQQQSGIRIDQLQQLSRGFYDPDEASWWRLGRHLGIVK